MKRRYIISYVLFAVGIFFMPSFLYAANIYVSPSQQTTGCVPTEITIGIHTSGDRVIASDIKFFLQGLSLSGFVPLSGFDQVHYIGTGISTKGPNIGKIYHYINVYQNSFSDFITGNAIPIARFTITPILGNPNRSLSFYNLSGNDEDSNISVGIEYGTEGFPIRYNDALTSTIDGIYVFSGCADGGIIDETPPSGGGGGGGGTLTMDDCTLPSALACANTEGIDNSDSYYDSTCCAPESHGTASDCDVSDSMYNQEMTDAFSRGYGLNITNKCPIDTARLDDYILRKELAKMMTLFTIQVVGIYPDTNKEGCDQFDDSERLSDEMKFYTKTSCQLNLMGLEPDGTTPKQSFDPEEYVDRAQFGTILSRLIYGDVYNVYAGEEQKFKRYEKHLRALYEADIMKKIQDPLMLERRGRVLIMLQRTTAQNLVEQYRMVAPSHNGALTLLENVR